MNSTDQANMQRQALALRRAVQLGLRGLSNEDEILSVAGVWPLWAAGVDYAAGDILAYGVNAVGDPQLYRVLQAHRSQADWTPDAAVSLYQAVGLAADGTPLWVQPLGAADAYAAGDVVIYAGSRWRSRIDGNVWAPDVYPAGWEAL